MFIYKAARKQELTKLLRFLNALLLHYFTFLKRFPFIFFLIVLLKSEKQNVIRPWNKAVNINSN